MHTPSTHILLKMVKCNYPLEREKSMLSKNKIGGAQWHYIINILRKFHENPSSRLVGVADKLKV